MSVPSQKPKPIKMGETRSYEVDGMTVVLKRVEPTYYRWDVFTSRAADRGNAEQKSRHEILVNDKHFGWINCPYGIAAGWQIVGHGRTATNETLCVRLDDMLSPWVVYPKKDQIVPKMGRDDLVALVPDLIRSGDLVSRARMDEMIAIRKVKEAEIDAARVIKEREKDARREREKIENLAKRVADREALVDRIEGVKSLLGRMRSHMSNLEAAAVASSLEIFERKLVTHDAHTAAFFDDERKGV